MEKILIIIVALSQVLFGSVDNSLLQSNCLDCHREYKMPNNLIYKRYLSKYSTSDRIENAIYLYLTNPKIKTSIMPPEFFLKFPLKKSLHLDKEILKSSIDEYIRFFDIKNKLTLKHQ